MSDIVILIVGLVVGAVGSFFITIWALHARDPVLIIAGRSGGGNQAQGSECSIDIKNDTRSFIRWRRSRETAEKVQAYLFDARGREPYGGPLAWQNLEPPYEYEQFVDIPAGSGKRLKLVSRAKGEAVYGAFHPGGNWPTSKSFDKRISDSHRDFLLVLRDQVQRETKIPITIDFSPQELAVRSPLPFDVRLSFLRQALYYVGRAFSTRRY